MSEDIKPIRNETTKIAYQNQFAKTWDSNKTVDTADAQAHNVQKYEILSKCPVSYPVYKPYSWTYIYKYPKTYDHVHARMRY